MEAAKCSYGQLSRTEQEQLCLEAGTLSTQKGYLEEVKFVFLVVG
jgi:hypothetical protein